MFKKRCCKYTALDSIVSRMAYNVNLITGKGGKNIGTINLLRLKIPENFVSFHAGCTCNLLLTTFAGSI